VAHCGKGPVSCQYPNWAHVCTFVHTAYKDRCGLISSSFLTQLGTARCGPPCYFATVAAQKKGHLEPKKRETFPGLTPKTGLTQHPFDLRYGVRTSGLIAGRHLKSGHTSDRHATAYYGVAPSVFASLLRRWQRTGPIAHSDEFTFIDIGAGMGRTVLLASMMRFRAVVGVELHPALLRIARANCRLWRKDGRAKTSMRLMEGDAAQFRFPPGPCLAFLFNPFGGPVMRRFARHIAASFSDRPGELDLLYVNDEQGSVLRLQPGIRRIFHDRVLRSPADARADHSILARQPGGEYRTDDYEDCSIWRWVGQS
jgi:predicted RNA methylase